MRKIFHFKELHITCKQLINLRKQFDLPVHFGKASGDPLTLNVNRDQLAEDHFSNQRETRT